MGLLRDGRLGNQHVFPTRNCEEQNKNEENNFFLRLDKKRPTTKKKTVNNLVFCLCLSKEMNALESKEPNFATDC